MAKRGLRKATVVPVDAETHALLVTQSTSGTSGVFPTAAALADASANPTTPLIGSDMLGYNGATWDRVRLANISKDLNAVNTGSIITVWTPAAGKKFRLMGGSLSASAAINVLFEDNAAGAGNFIFRTPKLLADTPYTFVVNGGQGYLSAAINQVLKATGSGAGTVTGTLWGTEE